MKTTSHAHNHLSSVSQLVNFIPDYIHCSDDYNRGIYRRCKDEALDKKYIRINTWKKSTLLFDIDQGDCSAGLWTDFGFQPTWISKNRVSGNCHFGYVLSDPVICNHWKPQNYFSDVQYAMNHLLNGDTGYNGVLTKNPFHQEHELIWNGILYDLGTLGKASLQFAPKRPKRKRIVIDLTKVNNGERNVSMFHEVRGVAYVEVRNFRRENRIFSLFYEKMLEHSTEMNYSLIEPLTLPEVRSINTSVCKWTFVKDPEAEKQFRKRQSERGKISAMKRRIGSLEESKPWEKLKISRRTYFYKRKGGII